ncbi:MAG: GNAT family N-acetyltransferase [Candidatus Omnitrophica bacterium]|nr:GNAT family N-acetyltransferase [Candidatus Omnitrophota bacterium]
MKYFVRKYVETDKSKIIEFIQSILEEYSLKLDLNYTDCDLNNISKVYGDNKGIFLIAENNGAIIGTIGLKLIHNDFSQLCKFYVHKDFRKNGIGTDLLTRVIEFAEKNNYTSIGLEVSKKHQAAIKLYENFGFVLVKTPSACPRCDYIYVKKLEDSPNPSTATKPV